MFEVFPLRFEPKLWPQRTQREGPAHIVAILSAGQTLIVDAEGAELRRALAHLLTGYLGPLTFVTWPRPLLIHRLMYPTHTWASHMISLGKGFGTLWLPFC